MKVLQSIVAMVVLILATFSVVACVLFIVETVGLFRYRRRVRRDVHEGEESE
jgi:biopolymer transport protein ExbB/TolQ